MFDLVRNNKRWMLFLVLILILPSFVFFGIEGYTRFMEGEETLVEVNGEPISKMEFDNARRDYLEQARQTLGNRFDPLQFDTPTIRQEILDQLIDSRVLAAATLAGGYAVSDATLRDAILAMPAVQVDGRFNAERYQQVLAAQGLSPAQFEGILRYDMAQSQVLGPIERTTLVPRRVVTDLVAAMTQERDVRLRNFEAADFVGQVQVDDAAVKADYDAHPERHRVPERIDADFLVLDGNAVMGRVQVSDEELQPYYQQNASRFSVPESRHLRHILIAPAGDAEAQARAKEVHDKLVADPSQFAALAAEFSADPGSAAQGGSLGWMGRGALVGAFEDAAFALPKGGISEPVATDFGYHIIQVEDIREPSAKPFAEVRDQLAEEVRRQKAGALFGELAGRLTQAAYDGGDSLEPLAEALGLAVQQANNIEREAAPAGAPEWFADARVRQALFTQEVAREGQNSGVIELSPDRLLVVRAREVKPAHVAAFDEVQAQVRDGLVQAQARDLAVAAGEAALAEIQANPAAASGLGARQTVTRQNPVAVPEALLQQVMVVAADAELPQAVGAATPGGYALAVVEAIRPGAEVPADEVAQERAALARLLGQEEAKAMLDSLRKQFNVKIEPIARTLVEQGDE